MTSRELVYRTLEHKNTDGRAPRDLWIMPWAHLHYPTETAAIIDAFPSDFDCPPAMFSAVSTVEQGDPYAVGEYVDAWGCTFVNMQAGIIGEVKKPLITGEDWRDTSQVVFPEFCLDFDVEKVNRFCAATDQFFRVDGGVRPFERLQFIRGTEDLYMDLMDPPAGFWDFVERLHDYNCRITEKWAQTDVDAITYMDDWGSQKSLLISPQMWRTYFKPMYRDYIDIAHRHGKKIFMHSDGYILDILPDLIDLGLDAVNTQLFCMGVDKLAPFKGEITFWGEICRQHILPEGTPDTVRQAVRQVYDTLWQDGGCIAQCEFGPGAKPENVAAVFEVWNGLTGR